MPGSQQQVAAAFSSLGLAPRTVQWACGLRDGSAAPLPRDLPRPKPPPLDTGYGIRKQQAAPSKQPQLSQRPSGGNKRSVDMLSLANLTRTNWRNNVQRAIRELFVRWHLAHVAGMLARRPPPLPVTAGRADELSRRVLAGRFEACYARWREEAATISEHEALVDLFRPHTMRQRCAACFAMLVARAELVAHAEGATRRVTLLRGFAYWGGLFMRHRRQLFILDQLASVANAASSTRSRASVLAGAFESWRRSTASDTLAQGRLRLGALMAVDIRLRRGLAEWIRASLDALALAHKRIVGDRFCSVRRLRRGFTQLMRVLLAARRGAEEDMRLLESLRLDREPKVRYLELVARVTRRQASRGYIALRAELWRIRRLKWAGLHSCTRGVLHARREAFCRWCAHVACLETDRGERHACKYRSAAAKLQRMMMRGAYGQAVGRRGHGKCDVLSTSTSSTIIDWRSAESIGMSSILRASVLAI